MLSIFDWVLSDTLRYEDSYEPNIWQDIQDTGTYNLQLLAQTVDGCWDSTESQFKVYPIFRFFIPNAFSPNGNGVNETFGPKGRYFDDKTFKMQIFSRWGELVFETEDFFRAMGWQEQKRWENATNWGVCMGDRSGGPAGEY
jgi:hypothetical protein